jgi:uncharacterized protein (TIGR02266 family)
MKHAVIHFEIGGPDLKRAQRFYSELFGWGDRPQGGSSGIAGELGALREAAHPYVTVYVEVDDVELALKRAEELGGARLSEPAPIPAGLFAWFEDPDGNTIGLLQRRAPPEQFTVRYTREELLAARAQFDQSRLLRVAADAPPPVGTAVELSLELADRPAVPLGGEVAEVLEGSFLARVQLSTADRIAFEEALKWAAIDGRHVRSEPRFPTVFPVTLKDDDPKVLKYVKNLSRKGAFIRTRKSPTLGSVVTLQLKLPDGLAAVETAARVVRVVTEEQAAQTGGTEGIGVRFETMSAELRARLDAFITALEGRSGKLAIVADDDALIRTMVAQLLEAQGMRVEQASSGPAVLGLIEQHRAQLSVVVLDLMMPGSDGLELVRDAAAKLQPSKAPIVVLTAGGPGVAMQAIERGARRAILKGTRPEDVLAVIEAAMSGS